MVKLSLKTILVAGIGLVISSLISGYFFSIGADLWKLTIEGKLDLGSPFWLVSFPLGIIGISLLIYGIHLGKHKPTPQGESLTMSIPSKKRAGWLSKLRRPPIKKGKKADFWTTMIIMVIIGPISLIIALGFSSASLSQEVIFAFLVFKYTMIGFGLTITALSIWFMMAELYAMWEPRKQLIMNRETTYLNLVKKFDRAFRAVQEASDPDIKAMMLADFQDQLHALCYDYEWSKAKDRVEKVLEFIVPEKLFNEPHAKKYIQFLAMIINRFGEHVISIISQKWLREIDKFYDDPKYDTSSISNVLYILLQLRGYSKGYLTKLVDDATNRWSELKFQMLAGDLGVAFDELKKRDESGHEEIISYLRRKMGDAKQDKEERAYGRLNTLFNMANR